MTRGLGSPTVYRDHGFRFVMYYNEQEYEPPHVHVFRGRGPQASSAKFWLRPVALNSNDGLSPADLRRAHEAIEVNLDFLLEQWNDIKTGKR